MEELQIGDKVTAFCRTGKYIGEITAIRPEHFLVRILGVINHPKQGDLHNPNDADVPLFHERKALAYREQTNVTKKMVKPFEGDVPDYTQSLKAAVEKIKADLQENPSPWAIQSLRNIESLEMDYFKQ